MKHFIGSSALRYSWKASIEPDSIKKIFIGNLDKFFAFHSIHSLWMLLITQIEPLKWEMKIKEKMVTILKLSKTFTMKVSQTINFIIKHIFDFLISCVFFFLLESFESISYHQTFCFLHEYVILIFTKQVIFLLHYIMFSLLISLYFHILHSSRYFHIRIVFTMFVRSLRRLTLYTSGISKSSHHSWLDLNILLIQWAPKLQVSVCDSLFLFWRIFSINFHSFFFVILNLLAAPLVLFIFTRPKLHVQCLP